MAEPDRAGAPSASEAGSAPAPDTPTDLGGRSWRAAVRRTVREFKDDFLQDRAAALTYYGVLAIFPGILVLVSLLGLIGKSSTQPLVTNLTNAAPSSVRTILKNATSNLEGSHGAGLVAVVGILLAGAAAATPRRDRARCSR